MGENWMSETLSLGAIFCGISTSLDMSPVVDVVDAAGVLPKSAMVDVAGIGSCDVVRWWSYLGM